MALAIGQTGWLELDANGVPVAEALPDPPALGVPAIQVKGVAVDPTSPFPTWAGLLTLTGAPVTDQMNAKAELWDAGMLDRNPIPAGP